MKKNEYSAPMIEVVEIAYPQLMSTVSSEQSGAGTGEGEADDSDPELGGRRRGVWGNFWV